MKIIPNIYYDQKVSVYASLKNTLLLNELIKIFNSKNINVTLSKKELENCNYVISDKIFKESFFFTENTVKAIALEEYKNISRKDALLIKKNFNLYISYSNSVFKTNPHLVAMKIANELLSVKSNTYKKISLSVGENEKSLSATHRLKSLVYMFSLFVILTNLLIFIQLKSSPKHYTPLCKTNLKPYLVSTALSKRLKNTPVIGRLYGDSEKVLMLKENGFKLMCHSNYTKINIDNFFLCLINDCTKIEYWENESPDEKFAFSGASNKPNSFYDDMKKSETFLKETSDIYSEYKIVYDNIYKIISSKNDKNIVLMSMNPEIPTSNGGLVVEMTIYSFNNFRLKTKNTLDLNEISKRLLNTTSFAKYQKMYFISNDSISINSQRSFAESFQNIKNIIQNIYDIKIDGVILTNMDILHGFSTKNPEDTLKKLKDKDITIIFEEDDNIINLYENLSFPKTDLLCGEDFPEIRENSFEADTFPSLRTVEAKIDKKGDRYFYNILYQVEGEELLSKKINLTLKFTKNSHSVVISPTPWFSEITKDAVYYETTLDLLKNNETIISYFSDESKSECSNVYSFTFKTQPGLKYNLQFQANIDNDQIPLNNNSLTRTGERSYNTSLFGQKTDAVFEFYEN